MFSYLSNLGEWLLFKYSHNYYTTFTSSVNIIVAIISLFFIVWVFKKYNLINYLYTRTSWFLFSLYGWVLFGLSFRVMNDLHMVHRYTRLLVITPFIYIEVLLISYLFFVLFLKLNNIDGWGYAGYILSFPFFVFDIAHVHIFRFNAFLILIILMLFFYLLSLYAFKDTLSRFSLWFQMFDGASTFISITFFGFGEEHIVAEYLIRFAETHGITLFGSGAWLFLLVKFIVIYITLLILDTYFKDYELESSIIKLFMVVLGMAVGSRNTFNLLFV